MHDCGSSVPRHQDHDNISAGVMHQESGGVGGFTLVSNHDGSLLRQQPGAAPVQKRLERRVSKAQCAYTL